MIKLDQNYSDYTDETDAAYPAGKAVNASTSESYDGTPILADMINDLHGARQAIYKEAYGSVNGLSGEPDNVNASDTLNAIKKLIDDPNEEHAALRGVEAHGATSEVLPGQIVTRDEFGCAKFAAPLADEDAANKFYVDDLLYNMPEEINDIEDDWNCVGFFINNKLKTKKALFKFKFLSLWEYLRKKLSEKIGLTDTSYGGNAKAIRDKKNNLEITFSYSSDELSKTSWIWASDPDSPYDQKVISPHDLPVVTQSKNGLMSADDKEKLDNINIRQVNYVESTISGINQNFEFNNSNIDKFIVIGTSSGTQKIKNNSSYSLKISYSYTVSDSGLNGGTIIVPKGYFVSFNTIVGSMYIIGEKLSIIS